MKHLIKLSIIAAAIAATSIAQAADDYTGAYAGVTFTKWSAKDSGDSLKKSGASIKAGYDFNKSWAIEGRINLAQYKETSEYSTIKISTPAALYGKYRYAINNTVAPYAVAGLAYNSFSYNEANYKTSSKSVGLSAGIGAEITVTKNIKATVEYTYLGNNDYDGTESYNASAWSIGANYKF